MPAWWRKIIPSKNDREIRRYKGRVEQINALEASMKALPDEALQAKTEEFRQRYKDAVAKFGGDPEERISYADTKEGLRDLRKPVDQALDSIMAEAFAVCREASTRVLKMRHYDVQLLGGMVLHEGRIAEMKTGEGKTLVATLAVYLNAIAGRGVHLITVNEYLATRDAQWMGQLYNFLGLSVGVIVHGLTDQQRKEAYAADITYGTNSEFGFDYLRDNMKLQLGDYSQRGHHFAIVDEVDSILIDEARTPLIISGPAEDGTEKYLAVNKVIPGLRRERDYTIDEKARSVSLTDAGMTEVEKRLGIDNLYDPDNLEMLHHVNQALRAHTIYRRDVDYMVTDGKVRIIDEFTGRVLDGRRWSDGLHQAVEAKEGVKIENENQTLATITYQNYFRMYAKLGGMTGTAETEAEEFASIYDLDCVVVPTNRPIQRKDYNDLIYLNEGDKFSAIAEEVITRNKNGQPVLVGTVSVQKSELLSRVLTKNNIAHSVLNAKQHGAEATIVAQAGRKGSVTIATNMAGRGTDILLGGNPEFLAGQALMEQPDADDATKMQVLQAMRVQCEQEKKEVLDAGGLVIIGSERHESRRIDNQLRGRAGRQGDPGSSRFFVSLDDDLMRIFGGERIKGMMSTLGMKAGEVIEAPMVNKSIESAQRKVEGHHFDIRKHLLDYDDVMNEQRKAVYKQRRRVIAADVDATRELMLDSIERVVVRIVDRCCPEKSSVDEWNLTGLEELCKEIFGVEVSLEGLQDLTLRGIENEVFRQVDSVRLGKEEEFTAQAFLSVGRIIFLQTIDSLWKNHLRGMDQLREGINLRGYAQKDPKHEYKKEGYNLFAGMMGSIHTEFLQKAMRVVITTETEEEYQRRLETRRARQQQLAQESANRGAEPPAPAGAPGSGGAQAPSASAGQGKPQGNRAQRRRQAALEKKQGRGSRSA